MSDLKFATFAQLRDAVKALREQRLVVLDRHAEWKAAEEEAEAARLREREAFAAHAASKSEFFECRRVVDECVIPHDEWPWT